MPKRKTLKQKQKINRISLQQLYNNPEAKISLVKREIVVGSEKKKIEARADKEAVQKAKSYDGSFNKRGIVKSLVLASLILSLEVVLYFVWK